MSIGLGYRPGATSVPTGGGGGAGATPYTLTSITDIPSGAVDGEAGELNGRIYVLATVTIAAGAGGGTMRMWLPPEVEAGSPEVIGWFDGDEDAATLTAQGNSALGTIATTGTEIEFLSTGASSSRFLQSTSVATSDRFYFRGLYRGSKTGGGSIFQFVYLLEGGANDFISVGSASTGVGFLTSGFSSVGTLRTPVTNVPASADPPLLVETVHHGMDVFTETYGDGQLLASYRGDLQTAGAGDFVIAPLAYGGAGGTCQILASYQAVLRW